MRKLTINGAQLLERIDTSDAFERIVADIALVTELDRVGCITWSQREHTMNIVHRRDRNDKLLEFLSRRSVAHFNKFVNILAKEQVQFLVTDGGET